MDSVHSDPLWSLVVKSVVGISSAHDLGLSGPKQVVLVCLLGEERAINLMVSSQVLLFLAPDFHKNSRKLERYPEYRGESQGPDV